MNKYLRVLLWIIVGFGILEILGNITTLLSDYPDKTNPTGGLIFWIIVELFVVNALDKDAKKRKAEKLGTEPIKE
jgi:hypothetical protein